MRSKIAERYEKIGEYITYKELKELGVTTRRISYLLENNMLEKLELGIYRKPNIEPSKLRKYIEICMADERVVVCADSSLYLHGLIEEPEQVHVMTNKERNITRLNGANNINYKYHLSSEDNVYSNSYVIKERGYDIRVHEPWKGLCDYMRLCNGELTEPLVDYMLSEVYMIDKMLMYADEMKCGKKMEKKIYDSLKKFNRERK